MSIGKLYCYNPALAAEGKNPLQIDSKPPKVPLQNFFSSENRYRVLQQSNPAVAAQLLKQAQKIVKNRREHYAWMAKEE